MMKRIRNTEMDLNCDDDVFEPITRDKNNFAFFWFYFSIYANNNNTARLGEFLCVFLIQHNESGNGIFLIALNDGRCMNGSR